ncbi:MAG: nickel-dependent hydrogenase large subunit [Aquificaceae bacterium]
MKTESVNLARFEGEAKIKLVWKDGIVADAKISLPSTRNIERVLAGRPYMDALVITPRVCGICGHAHLIASAKAIENLMEIEPTQKAELVRKITQNLELLQNHIKWFYLFLMPDFVFIKEDLRNLYGPFSGERWRKAIEIASSITKGIALFSGQWPHSSYAIPGGITSQPTYKEIVLLKQTLLGVKDFFFKLLVGMEEDEFYHWFKRGSWKGVKGDMGIFLELSEKEGLLNMGRSYNRLISFGNSYTSSGYYMKKVVHGRMKLTQVEELKTPSYTKAPPVRYKGLPFETGPISRQLLAGTFPIKEMHKELGDSFVVRVFARILEIWNIMKAIENWLEELKDLLHQPSTSLKRPPSKISGTGYGVVEAARGSLIHKVKVKNGFIESYSIITPSQWNLGPRCEKFYGVAEKSLFGLKKELHVQIILRSFDLCSVCTTH